MVDIMKKICMVVVCLSLCISVAFVSMVVPSFAAVITDTTTWQPIEIDKLEYYSGSEYVSVLPFSTSSYLVTSTSNFPLSFQGSTAYSALFNLPVLSYTNMDLYFDLTPASDLDKVYTSASSVYLTFSLAFYCTSINFVYPETISVQNATLYTDSVTFSKVEDLSGDKAYATYVGTINLNPTTMSNVSVWQWISYFSMGGQMQGYNVTYAIAASDPVYTFTYEDAEAVEQATFDIISNQLAPTVQNIETAAQQIVEGQEAIKESIDKLPSAIVDEQQKAEESNAAEELEEYNNSIENNTSSILDQITEDAFPIMGLGDSVGQLWSSVGSHNRTSGFVFPSIKVPNFVNSRSGDIVLSEEYLIDIDGAINALPSYFVIIFRSFFTIFLGWGALKFLIGFIMSLFTHQEKGDNA